MKKVIIIVFIGVLFLLGWFVIRPISLFMHVNSLDLKYTNELVNQNPNNPDAYMQRGMAKSMMFKHKEAIEDFNKVLELEPDNAEVYYNIAQEKYAMNDYQGAINDFEKSAKLNPNNALTYVYMGSVYDDMKKYEEALKYYNKAIEIDPENPEAYWYKWMFYSSPGDNKNKKEAELNRALYEKYKAIEQEKLNKEHE